MNNKVRDELAGIVQDNIYHTDYIDTTLEDIVSILLEKGLDKAEANVLAASVKYMVGLKSYIKPKLTDVQKRRICDYWDHVKSLETLIGVWGELSVTQLYRKFDKIKIYNHPYIDHILNTHPEVYYIRDKDINKYGNTNKMIITSKLVYILYEDYLEMKEMIG